MKKVIAMLLVFVLAFSGVSVFAEAGGGSVKTVTYGADNLNNDSGDLIIGFIGGSITEGSGATDIKNRWSTNVVNNYFKVNYPNKNITELNAAIGGTGSNYAMLRMRKDFALDSGVTPDVVFVEFAVNDYTGGGMGVSQCMESIVRQLLALPKIPVIIFVYTAATSSINADGTESRCLENAIASHHAVAERYGIYEINLNEYIWDGVKAGKYVWKGSLSYDGTHPSDEGHRIYTDRICEMLKKDKSKAFVKLDPYTEPYGDYVYGKFEEVAFDDDSVKLTGDWKKKSYRPLEMSAYIGSYPDRFFRNGYMYAEDGTKVSAEYEFEGCGIGIDYVRTKSNADLQYTIYDDGGRTVDSGVIPMYYKTDKGRCCGQVIARDLSYGKYKIVVKGVLNSTAVEDHKNNEATGGSGLELHMGYFVVEKEPAVIYPSAKDVKVKNAVVNEKCVGEYTFSCKKYTEKDSETALYISDTEKGNYVKIKDGNGYVPDKDDCGKYIRFAVTPKNSNGDIGRTVYSEPVKIARQSGKISFKTPISITVNNLPADKPGTGKNVFSGTICNTGENTASVYAIAVVYNVKDGYKYVSQKEIVSKTILPGNEEEFKLEISASEQDDEIKIITFSSDMLEPVLAQIPIAEYMTLDEESGVSVSVFRINRFK